MPLRLDCEVSAVLPFKARTLAFHLRTRLTMCEGREWTEVKVTRCLIFLVSCRFGGLI
jgi:hypothetical protein